MAEQTLRVSKTVDVGNGEKIAYPRLSIYDLYAVTDGVKAEREAKAKKLGAELKLGNYELYNVLHEIRTRPVNVAELLSMCDAPQGAVEVLVASLRKAGKSDDDAKALISRMGIPDTLAVAKDLILSIEDEAPAAPTEAAGESPLPASPSTSQPTPQPEPKPKDEKYRGYGS